MDKQFTWRIKCPVSKKEFVIDNGEAIPDECVCCDDENDKREIRKATPYKVFDEVPEAEEFLECEDTANTLILTDLSTRKVLSICGDNLPDGYCVIGRKGDVEPDYFNTPDKYVSRLHCRILYEDSKYKIRDLQSENGTTVNGNKPYPVALALSDSDLVCIADRKFEVSFCRSDSSRNEVHCANL